MTYRGARLAALALLVAVAGTACGASSTSGRAAYSLNGRVMAACTLQGVISARCGALSVAENPAAPGGRHIDLNVAVVPASGTPVASDPVFFLAGGPGGAATELWALASMTFREVHYHHDIVLVDQRGTGASHPLFAPTVSPGENPADYVRRVLATMDGDPRYYTTAMAMDDLDAVRAALGYSRIDLYGASYGATAAQYYMRQHADHVRAAVLDGGTSVDVPIFELVAANSQHALDKVLDRCLSDFDCSAAFPRLRDELTAVLARLDRQPAPTFLVDSGGQPIVVTRDLFAGVIHSKLLSANDAAVIPLLIHRAAAGDFGGIASAAASVPSAPGQVMSVVIRCTEAWARYDPSEVRRTGAGSYYLAAQVQNAQDLQAGCQFVPHGFVYPNDAEPVASSAPVLFLNGEADPQDPPSNVASAAALMPGSLVIAVPDQGHTVGGAGCLPTVVAEFFDQGAPDAKFAARCAATVATPPFQLNS